MTADTTTVVIPAPASAEELDPPMHPDGRPWIFMMARGDEVVLADTRTALVCHVLDRSYYEAAMAEDEEEMFRLRYDAAVTLAHHAQRTIVGIAQKSGDFDVDELVKTPEGDAHLQALMIERTVPYEGPQEWTGPCPLVLIATDYAPFTDRTAPVQNVWCVDPSNEQTFLDSMDFFDQVTLLTNLGAREPRDKRSEADEGARPI